MQTLTLRASLTRLHFLRPKLLLFYSTAADDPLHRRRPESYHSSSLRRQHEEESRSVRVTVWWDFENCSIPYGVNVFRVAQRITSALRSNGIKGPVTINAFGDVAQLSRTTQEALTSTGVCLTHVPHSGKNSSDRFFMADLIYWVSQNPPPMHFFLISGDRDFANILHRLRMSNYNILLASSDCASSVLWSSATIIWPWNGLVRGEDVVVKHFNHPPDGFYGSWYGHYKGVLDDPFENMDQTTISQPKEFMEQIADTKPRPIPKALVNGIRRILNLYPEGITLSELRAELMRNNLNMDKDFFGYKKFSHLLSSLTNILQFKPHLSGEGQPLVVSARKKLVEPVELTAKPVMEKTVSNEDKEQASTKSITHSSPADGPIISPSSTSKETDVATSAASISTRKDVTDPRPTPINADANLKETSSGITATNTLSSHQKPDTAGEGLFRKLWRALTGNKAVQSSEECAVVLYSDNNQASLKMEPSKEGGGSSGTAHSEDKKVHTKNGPSPLVINSQSLDVNKSPSKDKLSRQSENCIDVPNISSSYVNRVARWWRFLLYGSQGPDDSSVSIDMSAKGHDSGTPGKYVEGLAQASCRLEAHDSFSKSHFWNSLEQFLLDSKGTDLIIKSGTREELVHGLQKESPSFLKGLGENHLHHLVDLLVSQKKWLEESSSQAFPFRLVMPARDNVPSNSQSSNGLSSLFTSGASQSKPEKGHDLTKKKTRSREEILCDCHKLLVELLKENPDGFNMCSFKPAFIQKYGYILDHQMLGYPKLASLLNIMPGARLESSFILPAGKFCLDSGSEKLAADETIHHSAEADRGETVDLNSRGPSSGDESAWEELGPVAETGDKVGFSEASLSDEDFTDSEDDVSRFTESESQHKTGEEESSALLQVLDSWYSSKESEKDQTKTADGLVDCSGNNAQNSSNQKASNFSKIKTKHHRTYSFVSDSVDEKEKLVDSILESLKKSGPSKLHS
ncbi:putative NYN domain, limkain-b1-type, meiosis regulator and mRNA stability factor 1 [Dioscorea sansibarensis]